MTAGTVFAPCYHLVSDGTPAHVRHLYRCRTVREFEADLEFLLKNFIPLSLEDLHSGTVPRNSFFLSFDDGFREMSEIVAPICLAKGVPATFFLTSGFLDNRELGFRHKASLLIEKCQEIGFEKAQKALGQPAELRRFFRTLRYKDRSLLDDAATILGVDFDEYLRSEQPYMTTGQVRGLVAQGFSIGGHSVDHPLYSELPLAGQLNQTAGCMTDLTERFHSPIRAFAFPFVSDGVPEEFYEQAVTSGMVDRFFCIGGMPQKHRDLATQRFGVEGAQYQSLEQILQGQASRDTRKRILQWRRGAEPDRAAKATSPVNPLVSLLIPAHNAERWIRQAIDSALSQTYSPKEVIVVDDGSTDGTAEVIQGFGDRIRFVRSAHAGGNATRNALLDLARGEWVQFLDADDYLLPHKISDQMHFIADAGRELDVVYSPFLLRTEESRTAVVVSPAQGRQVTEHFITWSSFWTGALLFRRSAILDVGGWRDGQPCCQEHELLLRMICAEKKFELYGEVRAVYRMHSTDTVSRRTPFRTILVRMDLTERCVAFIERKRALSPGERRALYAARMESARGIWPYDPRFACELANRASQAGRYWTTGSPALPFRFQIACLVLGFRRAQDLAARKRHGAPLDSSTNCGQEAQDAPLVSILIPAYNAERWIRQSIESALTQTYARKEIIVVDDGSTDGTVEAVREFGDQVRLVERHHAGGNASRNVLLECARGEWLQYLDADDYLLPNKVADQMQFLTAKGGQLDVIYSPYYIRQESLRTKYPSAVAPKGNAGLHYIFWSPFCTHGMLLRRSAVMEVKGWKEDQLVCQEHELLLRFIKGGKRFGFWKQAAAVYRFHASGTVSRKNKLRTVRTRMGLTDECEAFLKESNQLTSAHRKALYAVRIEAARSAWHSDQNFARELVEKALGNGRSWVSGSPALPPHFQLAFLLLGFERAERLASLRRERGQVLPRAEGDFDLA